MDKIELNRIDVETMIRFFTDFVNCVDQSAPEQAVAMAEYADYMASALHHKLQEKFQ